MGMYACLQCLLTMCRRIIPRSLASSLRGPSLQTTWLASPAQALNFLASFRLLCLGSCKQCDALCSWKNHSSIRGRRNPLSSRVLLPKHLQAEAPGRFPRCGPLHQAPTGLHLQPCVRMIPVACKRVRGESAGANALYEARSSRPRSYC